MDLTPWPKLETSFSLGWIFLVDFQYNLHMYQISTRVGVGHFFKLDMTVICSGDVSIRMHCPFCPHTARSFVEIRYLQSP